jgi:3-oxoacyl-[acyl-carrier protein] reductase
MKYKVTLITGGAAGIGKATAKRFFEEGATVIICDLDEELGEKTVQEIGPQVAFYNVNVTDRQAVQNWVDDVVGILRDNLLVKVKEGELVKQMPEEDFDQVIAVNLKGVFNCTQAVAPYMIKKGSGVILNATSVVGLDGNFGQTNYVATKAGVIGMTRVWARELGRYNIRVNAVAPGFILTEMVQQMPQKILDNMIGHTPIGRMGQPRDIANTYLFLASEEASFITGATLRVDGGIVIGT